MIGTTIVARRQRTVGRIDLGTHFGWPLDPLDVAFRVRGCLVVLRHLLDGDLVILLGAHVESNRRPATRVDNPEDTRDFATRTELPECEKSGGCGVYA